MSVRIKGVVMPIQNIKSNLVQSIRAFKAENLSESAQDLGHHFLYADLARAQTKQDVLDTLAESFCMSSYCARGFDFFCEGLTDVLHRAGAQPGFVIVVQHIPLGTKFDKESREELLDVFRDACDYWQDRKVPFRCFFSCAVAMSNQSKMTRAQSIAEFGEPMPTAKVIDLSPFALRMSNPFNSAYWENAA
jgi:hypothetical protein